MDRPGHLPNRGHARALLRGALAFAVVDVTVGHPFPAGGGSVGTKVATFLMALAPSADALGIWAVVALLASLAVARRGPRAGGSSLPRLAVAALVAAIVVIRVLRIADGVGLTYFNHQVSFYVDLRLLPEFFRLMATTVPAPILALGGGLALALIAGLASACAWALRTGAPLLARPAGYRALAVAAVAIALGSFVSPPFRDQAVLRAAGPRAWHEAAVFAARERLWRRPVEDAARLQQRLEHAPRGLEALHGADVFLFVVESYGRTALRAEPDNAVTAALARATDALAHGGFQAASRWLDSPTYAGRSWLAQSTLATGVRSEDAIAYDLVQQLRPRTLPRFFHDGGYHTVIIQPGTTTPDPPRWMYGFDEVLSAWDLGYRGRAFGWARIPDQFTLGVMHARVVAPARVAPVFVEVTLVSSHAPWSFQPPLIDDETSLGDGRIYDTLPPVAYPLSWLTLDRARPAYLRSIAYDLDLVFRYALLRGPARALYIVLGDHQPVAEVTGGSASSAVPIHAFSRDADLVRALGAPPAAFTPGLVPPADAPVAGMETLMETLLAAYSDRDLRAHARARASTPSDRGVDW